MAFATRLDGCRAAASLAASLANDGALLGQQHRVDVRYDAARRDRHAAEQLVQLLVVAHRQLNVAWHLETRREMSNEMSNTTPQQIKLTMRCFLLSRDALPASSRISAAKYSITAAM
jgi:hypothetical protein